MTESSCIQFCPRVDCAPCCLDGFVPSTPGPRRPCLPEFVRRRVHVLDAAAQRHELETERILRPPTKRAMAPPALFLYAAPSVTDLLPACGNRVAPQAPSGSMPHEVT